MSTIYLSQNDTFIQPSTNTGDSFFGRAGGSETVILQGNPSDTILDGNIEVVQVTGTAANSTLQINASGKLELASGGIVYATFSGGLNQNVNLQFTNGNVTLTQTGATQYTIKNPTNASDSVTIDTAAPRLGSAVTLGAETSTAGGGTAGAPITTAVTATQTGQTFNAAAQNTTFDVADGTFAFTINNFAAGDVLDFRDVGGATSATFNVMADANQSDGQQQFTVTDPGDASIVTVTLVGLSATQDAALFNQGSVDAVFGAGTLLL